LKDIASPSLLYVNLGYLPQTITHASLRLLLNYYNNPFLQKLHQEVIVVVMFGAKNEQNYEITKLIIIIGILYDHASIVLQYDVWSQ
jgi:hypothetical protein